MNITNQEKNVLYKEKIKEKTKEEAIKEIKRDELFEKSLTLKNRVIKHKDNLIIKLEREVLMLKEKLGKERKKRVSENLKSKLDEIRTADRTPNQPTIKELNRIIALVDGEEVGLSELTKLSKLKPTIIKSCLNFLLRNNFIKQELDGRKIIFRSSNDKQKEETIIN